MKTPGKIAGCIVGILVNIMAANAQTGNTIVGKWKAEEDDKALQMEIYLAKDGRYYGKVINDNGQDSKNGKLVLKELKYNEQGKTYKGYMKVPDGNMELNVTLTLMSNDRLRMTGKKLIMSKTFYLLRIK
jgi:uncharacterized protein (DUF2147 family)